MTGLDGAYIVRVLMLLSIAANVVLGLIFNVFDENPFIHLALIAVALPLVIGCHIIIKKYGTLDGESQQQIYMKRHQAEKMYARLMFSWFGMLVGGFYLLFFIW